MRCHLKAGDGDTRSAEGRAKVKTEKTSIRIFMIYNKWLNQTGMFIRDVRRF